MPRPQRIDFPGCVHHVTARGNHRSSIVIDDYDRSRLFGLFIRALQKFDAMALAYCFMGNHYHFLVRVEQGDLSGLIRHINGVYTQYFNRRHGAVGHLFQGRFHSAVVDTDSYLVRVCSYTELNPVRAGLVRRPCEWRWSSYRAHVGLDPMPSWLDVDVLHGQLIGRSPQSAEDRQRAIERYASLVGADDGRLREELLSRNAFLGNDAFVQRILRGRQCRGRA